MPLEVDAVLENAAGDTTAQHPRNALRARQVVGDSLGGHGEDGSGEHGEAHEQLRDLHAEG